jgi:hypothetical protein
MRLPKRSIVIFAVTVGTVGALAAVPSTAHTNFRTISMNCPTHYSGAVPQPDNAGKWGSVETCENNASYPM